MPGGLALFGAITYFGKWKYLWTEWLTSVDHKRIGVMYIIVALIMLLRGFADAIMMRTQLAVASADSAGFLPPHHYDQIFTAHGVIMIFFMAMPFITGLMNIVVPLQIGARDVAYPFLNSLSFWLFGAGVVLMMVSLFVGEFAATGWLAYPPLSGLDYSPSVGVDYYIWALQISGLGTTLSGINFIVTILRMRAPGMSLMKMPIFTWTSLVTNVLIVAAFPVLAATLALLTMDRYLGTHFFTNDMGGNVMMYVNLIWIWGHPEVYILVLPAFGVYSEVVATFARKTLFGYKSMVYATAAIGVLSGLAAPLLHHGRGSRRQCLLRHSDNDHLDPDRGQDLQLAVHHLPRPPAHHHAGAVDAGLHDRVRHRRHDRRDAGHPRRVVRAAQQPVPDRSLPQHHHRRRGFRLHRRHDLLVPQGFRLHAQRAPGPLFVLLLVRRLLPAFMPLYILGFKGMTRRLNHYDNPEWQPYLLVALAGAALIMLGIWFLLQQVFVSVRQRKQNQT